MKHKLWFLIVFLSVNLTFSYAQQQAHKGVVVDSTTGELLLGVVIRNTSNPDWVTKTDNQGAFSIQGSAGDEITFSYIGFEKVNFTLPSLPDRVEMKLRSESISDVVVIGYGTVNKEDFTGALSEVNVEDISRAPVPNIAQALSGRVAGLQVNALSGQPGEDMDIIIRGGNSITQDNSPLYVVDGFPMEGFSLSSLNPEEIAELTVLKDASATAIFGSRGANGVIIIETKKGKEGAPIVSYDFNYGLQRSSKFMEMMNPYEFVKYQLEMDPIQSEEIYLTLQDRTLEDYRAVEGLDWQDMLFRTAGMQNHNLSMRGGNERTKYAISGNLADQDGVIMNSGFSRYQGRIRLEQEVNKNLDVNLNLSYSEDQNFGQLNNESASGNNSYATYIMYRTWGYRPFSTQGDLTELLFDDYEEGGATLMIMNPIITTENEYRKQKRDFFTANLGLDYKLPLALKLSVRGGYRARTSRDEYFNNSKTYKGYPGPNNENGVHGGISERNYVDWVNENTLSYKTTFNERHGFDALVGVTMQGASNERSGFTSTHIPNEELGIRSLGTGTPKNPISTASANLLLSYLGRVNYNLDRKYYLTASFRADGSSKFAPQNRWGYFPSFAASWQLGREEFFQNLPVISDSKLRVSWGATGNNRVSDFPTSSTISLGDRYGIGMGSSIPDYALEIATFGNKDLKWETTYQFDIGYELSLFKNRLNFVADYYNKNTRDLLLNANVPYAVGFQRIYKNIGSIQNRGFEFGMNSVNIDKQDFRWSTSFNISFNRNKVLELTDDEKIMFSSVDFTAHWNAANLYVAQVGKPVSSFYGLLWDGIYQYSDFEKQANGDYLLKDEVASNGLDRTQTQPGDKKYEDVNGDGVIDNSDNVIIGRTLPKHFGGFNNNFQYKNLSLNVFFQWNYGNDIMNANRLMFEGNANSRRSLNQYASYVNRWTPENASNEHFRTGGEGPQGYYSTRELEDGSFLRLKTVELGYQLPKKWLPNISSINLSVAAQNLYTWTNYTGLDPEVSTRNSILTPGFDYSSYAQNFTISFGAKVVF